MIEIENTIDLAIKFAPFTLPAFLASYLGTRFGIKKHQTEKIWEAQKDLIESNLACIATLRFWVQQCYLADRMAAQLSASKIDEITKEAESARHKLIVNFYKSKLLMPNDFLEILESLIRKIEEVEEQHRWAEIPNDYAIELYKARYYSLIGQQIDHHIQELALVSKNSLEKTILGKIITKIRVINFRRKNRNWKSIVSSTS